jgi:hypothetical protein
MDQWSSDFLMRSPMFEPLRPLGAALRSPQWPTLDDLQRLADAHEPKVLTRGGAPLRFVEQGARAAAFEDKYEVRIYLRGEVQIRAANWHDLFNALVWLTFPRAKAALNERHYLALKKQQAAGAPNRGPEQDVMTLFDEGGVIVVASDDELLQQIREFRWKELFWRNRARVQSGMRFLLFGHALYEKALRPFTGRAEAWSRGPVLRGCDGKGVHEPAIQSDALQPAPGSHLPASRQALLNRPRATGRGVLLAAGKDFFLLPLTEQLDRLDAMVTQRLLDTAALKTTRDLAPVPILGVPGWCEDNAHESYYDNVEYFRPGRTISL